MKRLSALLLSITCLALAACQSIEVISPIEDSFDSSELLDSSQGNIEHSSYDDSSENSSYEVSSSEADSSEPEGVIRSDFFLPEEFYEELYVLIEKSEVNLECTFDFDSVDEGEPQECGCEPELLLEGNGESIGPSDGTKVPEQYVLSIYFKDITSGYEFNYNPYPHFPVASVIKLPYILYVCEQVESNNIDLNTLYEYKEKHYFGGTGEIKEMEYGAEISLSDLICLSMEKSDNVAYEMLKDYIGNDGFTQYLIDNGITHSQDNRSYKVKVCARSSGIYAQMLYEYFKTESELSKKLKEWMKTSEAVLATTQNGTLYHKYGWADISFHDSAYIECEYPYVIGYASNLDGNWSDFTLLREISLLIEKYHDIYYDNFVP